MYQHHSQSVTRFTASVGVNFQIYFASLILICLLMIHVYAAYNFHPRHTTFYRAMQSAVFRLHVVCPSVRLSVYDVGGGSGPNRLEILEINCTDN